ncbi:class I SAM-dependent methyltransferase [Thermobifida halotolerans]|uniref:Class I SAM-dependent methyltransferase n=1 Tax=Thermobifida halotolerans TaxID=483545 RepID=A0A399G6X5_9ACTN|nr:class I SAM-dependent methyltransferase [Thermobifida halotolerans]UOE21010.1 class I SAM-dependent methyltransferase [Thermobifida halotolerans]
MSQISSNEANEGLYSPTVLKMVYTPVVIWFSHTLAWKLPNPVVHRNHREHVGRTHLTVGPGNGYFLAKLPKNTPLRTLHLLDLNRACLDVTAQRVGDRFDVHTIEQDALQRWPVEEAGLDSVDCHMMLHTVRGKNLLDKEALIAEAARALKPGGRFFGATVLAKGEGVRVNGIARRLLDVYNSKQNTFCNLGDSSEDLRAILDKHFSDVQFQVHGCTGVWVATK